jgi:hypothetical protein
MIQELHMIQVASQKEKNNLYDLNFFEDITKSSPNLGL